MSSWTSSIHLFLGLPFLLLPPGFSSSAIFVPFDCSFYVRGRTILIFTCLLLSLSPDPDTYT
jgi:hypothetical protein